jgi:hypothetical protein
MQRRDGQALVDAGRTTRRPLWLPHCSVFMSHPPKPPSTPTMHVNVRDRNLVQQMTLSNKRRYNVAGRKSSRIRLCAAARRARELAARKPGLFSIFVGTAPIGPRGKTYERALDRRHDLTGLGITRALASPRRSWPGSHLSQYGTVATQPHAGAAYPRRSRSHAQLGTASSQQSRRSRVARFSTGERACAPAVPPSGRNRRAGHICSAWP